MQQQTFCVTKIKTLPCEIENIKVSQVSLAEWHQLNKKTSCLVTILCLYADMQHPDSQVFCVFVANAAISLENW